MTDRQILAALYRRQQWWGLVEGDCTVQGTEFPALQETKSRVQYDVRTSGFEAEAPCKVPDT